MYYVVITNNGFGAIVNKEDWRWWPNCKTIMTEEEVSSMGRFNEACAKEYSEYLSIIPV